MKRVINRLIRLIRSNVFQLFPTGFTASKAQKRIKVFLRYITHSRFRRMPTKVKKIDVLICIHASRSEIKKDQNLEQYIKRLRYAHISFEIFQIPPASKLSIKKISNSYYANDLFLKQVIKGLILRNTLTTFFYWKEIFKKFKPRTLITYQPTEGLCEAASNRGIKVIELQHGALFSNHHYYSQYKGNRKFIPDIFLSWCNYSLNEAKKLQIAKKYKVIGFPEIAAKIDKEDSVEISKKANCILVTLSEGLEKEYTDYESSYFYGHQLYIPLLGRLIDKMKDEDWHWIFRMHPLSTVKEIEIMTRGLESLSKRLDNFSYEIDNESDLYDQLRRSRLHITQNSSCSLMSSYLGIHTVFTCWRYQHLEFIKYLGESELATLLPKGYDIKTLIESCQRGIKNYSPNQIECLQDSSIRLLHQ